MGIDVIYNKQNTSSPNFANAIALPAASGLPATTSSAAVCAAGGAGVGPVPCYRAADQDAWTGTFRVQRDFLP